MFARVRESFLGPAAVAPEAHFFPDTKRPQIPDVFGSPESVHLLA
jgi:hypothetical protein